MRSVHSSWFPLPPDVALRVWVFLETQTIKLTFGRYCHIASRSGYELICRLSRSLYVHFSYPFSTSEQLPTSSRFWYGYVSGERWVGFSRLRSVSFTRATACNVSATQVECQMRLCLSNRRPREICHRYRARTVSRRNRL